MNSQLNPEQQLTLLMSKLRQSEEDVKEAERLLYHGNKFINYDLLFEFATQNGVASILYKNSRNLQCVSDDFTRRLKNLYYSVLRDNILHLQETLNISKSLRENGIEVIILKGSLASDILFGDLGLYPTGDIDLLIKPSEIQKASKILLDRGYIIIDNAKKLEHSDYMNYQNGTYSIDLHWNLVEPYFDIPNDFWWTDAGQIMKDNEQLTFLSGERYLLFSICHLFSHGFMTLKLFSLVDAIIRSYKDKIDWKKLINYSEEYEIGRVVFFTVRLLHEILGTEVPERFSKKKLGGYKICKKLVVDGFFRESTLFFVRISVYLLLLAGPSALLRVTTKAIFPSPAKLRSRYGLSEKSKKVYIYYVLNPFLILLRKI
jgi:hypothetical protein